MIFIPKSVEPANFDADVRIPGNALLRLHNVDGGLMKQLS